MPLLCPECESPVTVDADEAEEGDIVACEDCGVELEVVSLNPLRIEAVDDSGYDDPEETPYHSGDGEEEE